MRQLIDTLTTSPLPWWMLCAYGVGSIPVGLLLARLLAQKDVRVLGSGNIGATNVARVAGRPLGVLTLLLDAAKGFAPVFFARSEVGETRVLLAGLLGLAAVTGHCFPVWLKGRGGKGVATCLGVLLALWPRAALVGVVVFAVTYFGVRLVSAASLVALAAVWLALLVRGPVDATVLPFAACTLIVVGRHHQNIRRLYKRSELSL